MSFNDICIRILIDSIPILFLIVVDTLRIDRIVGEGVGQSSSTELIIRKYDLFSMLTGFWISAFITCLNQMLVGRIGLAAMWLFIMVVFSLIYYPVVKANINDRGVSYRLQQFLMRHKNWIAIGMFILIIGTELFPNIF